MQEHQLTRTSRTAKDNVVVVDNRVVIYSIVCGDDYDSRRPVLAKTSAAGSKSVRSSVAVKTADVIAATLDTVSPKEFAEAPLLLKMLLIICSTPSTRGSSV